MWSGVEAHGHTGIPYHLLATVWPYFYLQSGHKIGPTPSIDVRIMGRLR